MTRRRKRVDCAAEHSSDISKKTPTNIKEDNGKREGVKEHWWCTTQKWAEDKNHCKPLPPPDNPHLTSITVCEWRKQIVKKGRFHCETAHACIHACRTEQNILTMYPPCTS